MLKTLIALTVAAGFASASFAQTGAPAPTNAPGVKVSMPAPTPAVAPVEKKLDAPKVEVTKAVEPVKAEAAKTDAVKAKTPPTQAKHTSKTAVVPEAKVEPVAPVVK
jgi:hypothetical protein